MKDRIITIRLNDREQKMLDAVVNKRKRYWSDGVSSIIKDLIKEAYEIDQAKTIVKK